MRGFGRQWGDTRLLDEHLFSGGEKRDGDKRDIAVGTVEDFKSC